jgi:hypothetical protein
MSIQSAYNEWSESYDTDENLTRDLDQKVTRETLPIKFQIDPEWVVAQGRILLFSRKSVQRSTLIFLRA